jgi:hypothetical protein
MEHREATFSGSFWLPESCDGCTPAVECLIEDAKRTLFGSMVYSGTDPSKLGTYRGRSTRLEFSDQTLKSFEGNVIKEYPVVSHDDCPNPSLFFDHTDRNGMIIPGLLRHLTKLSFGANAGVNQAYESIINKNIISDVISKKVVHLRMRYKKSRWSDTEFPVLVLFYDDKKEHVEEFQLPTNISLDSPNFNSLTAFYESIAGSGILQMPKQDSQESASKEQEVQSMPRSTLPEATKASGRSKKKLSFRDPYASSAGRGGGYGSARSQAAPSNVTLSPANDLPTPLGKMKIDEKKVKTNNIEERRWVGPFFSEFRSNQRPRLKKDYEFFLYLSLLDSNNINHQVQLKQYELDDKNRSKKFLSPLKKEAERLAPIKPWPKDMQREVALYLRS